MEQTTEPFPNLSASHAIPSVSQLHFMTRNNSSQTMHSRLETNSTWEASLYQFFPEVQLIVRVWAINHSYETPKLLWLILKESRTFIPMPTFMIVYSFFSEIILLSNPSWLSTTIILFAFFGKVLGYFPFTSVSYVICIPMFSARRKSVLLDFGFLLQVSYL